MATEVFDLCPPKSSGTSEKSGNRKSSHGAEAGEGPGWRRTRLEKDPAGGSALWSRGHQEWLWGGTRGAFSSLWHCRSVGPAGKKPLFAQYLLSLVTEEVLGGHWGHCPMGLGLWGVWLCPETPTSPLPAPHPSVADGRALPRSAELRFCLPGVSNPITWAEIISLHQPKPVGLQPALLLKAAQRSGR